MPVGLERSHQTWKRLMGCNSFCKRIVELLLEEDKKMLLNRRRKGPLCFPLLFTYPNVYSYVRTPS